MDQLEFDFMDKEPRECEHAKYDCCLLCCNPCVHNLTDEDYAYFINGG